MSRLGRKAPHMELETTAGVPSLASALDHKECRRLHRKYGTTYYFATQRLPKRLRRRVHALYGFVRVPDEWMDNFHSDTVTERDLKINAYRNEFLRGMDGVRPSQPVVRAFCDVAREVTLPLEEPLLFLDAMAMDIYKSRYETYEDIREYMRGSAASVGLMMCDLLEVPTNDRMRAGAVALGEAMQLTNFLRDIGEDMRRGRIYIPQEDIDRFHGADEAISTGETNQAFIDLMKFEIDRARSLYCESDNGISQLPTHVRKPVRLARILYSRILDRIEDQGYDVFTKRARTSRMEKFLTAWRTLRP